MPKQTNQTVYSMEKRINDILFNLCLFVTVIVLGMMLTEFFSRGQFPPPGISTFYIGVLLVYSLHKEALRWIEEKGTEGQQRKGEYFVYTWIIVVSILYLINFLTRDYFSYSQSGEKLFTLVEISVTALEVGGVFVFTRLFKIATIYLFKKNK